MMLDTHLMHSMFGNASVHTSWTCCKHCGHRHTYLREFVNTIVQCSICKKFYIAWNTERDEGKKESQDSNKDHAAKKRRKSVEEFTKSFEAKKDADECNKRQKQQDSNLESDFSKLGTRMDDLQKRMEEQKNKLRLTLKRHQEFLEKKKMRVKPNHHHIDAKIQELAIQWKRKIRIETPSSSREVLDFLHFIVACRLHKSIINQNDIARLASSIAHYKEAPTLFQTLGLDISSQADEDKHGTGKLRDILELVAVYKLEIDIPGELIVKLMVQRPDNQNQVVPPSRVDFRVPKPERST